MLVDEHPATAGRAQAWVIPECVLCEVGELCQRLDAGVARPDEHERKPARSLLLVERGVGRLELVEDVVAQVDRVGECLERECVLGQTGDRQRPRHGAECQHELAPPDRLRPLVRVNGRRLRFEVERGDAAEDELRVRAHDAQRHDAVARLERPGRGLGQERRVEHEVFLADDRGAAGPELARDVGAGEAAAEHEHAPARLSRCSHVS